MNRATFYQSALRHEQHEDVSPSSHRPFSRGSSEKGLIVILFALIYLQNDVKEIVLVFVLNAVCESFKLSMLFFRSLASLIF